jgi:hypothetical protein
MPRQLLRELVASLITETAAGRVKWDTTSVANAFRLNLGSKTIQIRQDTEWDGRDDDEYREVTVMAEDEILDSIKAFSGEDYVLLGQLYDEARASALNVDSQLSDLLKELKRKS